MARSFFTLRNDAALANASANFSNLISAAPTTYGLTAANASSYAAKQAAFAAAVEAVGNKLTKNTALVIARNDARQELVTMASDLAKIIDGTPTVTNEQKAELGLSVRKTPAPVPPPGTPYDFKATLLGNGDLELKWKCNNPTGSAGTVYQLFRKVNGVGDYEYVGGAGQKRYTDTSLPTPVSSISYQVQAIRSTAAGMWAEFVVNIGKTASGTSVASVTETTPAKLAA